jgi:hypothetical protein
VISAESVDICSTSRAIRLCRAFVELVDHIKVYENGNISVHFKFADEFRRIAEYIEINTTDTAEAG